MKIYNSLSRKVEKLEPIKENTIGMYACGPTVYDYVTIGNWRTYTLGDILLRTLQYLGLDVDYVMNITDVGHLTGDNLGDADLGEDRLEKSAKKEGKTAWDIAKFYTEDFLLGFNQLNLIQPKIFSKATDHIKEQIELVQYIEERGFAYKTSDGIYFNTRKYEKEGNSYGKLSTLDEIKEGVRIKTKIRKKDPRDFALWKFSVEYGHKQDDSTNPPYGERQMEWWFEGPFYGKRYSKTLSHKLDKMVDRREFSDKERKEARLSIGFPGWHIECSAMSMKYLGEQFDIHVGGEDLRSTHHPNEIAQSEAATGKKPFVKYWVHGAFLQVDGGRMGKSLGNAYTLDDIVKKGFNPLDLRYFYLTGHYKKQLNFTWKGLSSAAVAYKKLRSAVAEFRTNKERTALSNEKLVKVENYRLAFQKAIEDDLAIPEALSVVWEVVKSNIPSYDKYDLLMEFDKVLGLNLGEVQGKTEYHFKTKVGDPIISYKANVSSATIDLVEKRNKARKDRDFEKADKIREEIKSREGLNNIEDDGRGTILK